MVAVQPHEKGISVDRIGDRAGGEAAERMMPGQEMVTVFVPSSPTAFSGYVLVVPRESVVELPMDVTMKLDAAVGERRCIDARS